MGVTVFHLVSDLRTLLLDSPEVLQEVSSMLAEDGKSVKQDLEIPGKPRIPNGAKLVSQCDGKDPFQLELPYVAQFRLRSVGLGLVVRLRQRFGLRVTDIY